MIEMVDLKLMRRDNGSSPVHVHRAKPLATSTVEAYWADPLDERSNLKETVNDPATEIDTFRADARIALG